MVTTSVARQGCSHTQNVKSEDKRFASDSDHVFNLMAAQTFAISVFIESIFYVFKLVLLEVLLHIFSIILSGILENKFLFMIKCIPYSKV